MSVDLSTPQLLELVHLYYPANLKEFDQGYSESEQFQRLLQARREAMRNSAPWDRLLVQLDDALPDCDVEDWTMLFSDDACWRARVYLPEEPPPEGGNPEARSVVVLVSILAPVYVRYTSFRTLVGRKESKLFYEDVPATRSYADKVEALVRSELGVHTLPHDTLFTPVPDLHCGNATLGKAQLIDCLFTDDRW